jgi:hypothetical protein
MIRPGALLMLLVLSACNVLPPSGQVVARVNGIEITRRDVLIELLASGAPADVDTRTVQPELVDRIIIRKLLAKEAERQLIDRSPEFVGAVRRNREILLGETLLQRMAARMPSPSPDAVRRLLKQDSKQSISSVKILLQKNAERRLVNATIRRLREQAHIEYARPGS